jgi:hypothetical protein
MDVIADWRSGEVPNMWDVDYNPKPAVDAVVGVLSA